jgi:hypothetical protein
MVIFVSIAVILAIQLPLYLFYFDIKVADFHPYLSGKDFVAGCTICPQSFAGGGCVMLLVLPERKSQSPPPPEASCSSTVDDKDFLEHDVSGCTTSPSSTASR